MVELNQGAERRTGRPLYEKYKSQKRYNDVYGYWGLQARIHYSFKYLIFLVYKLSQCDPKGV